MVEGEFDDTVGAEAVGCSHGESGFVVQTLDDAAGKQLLSAEVVEDKLAAPPKRPGDPFREFDAGTNCLPAPLIEALRGPGRRVVVPEAAERLS